MNVSEALERDTNSIKQALNTTLLKKNLNQDAQAITSLINDFKNTNAKVLERSVTPYKGGNIDISI